MEDLIQRMSALQKEQRFCDIKLIANKDNTSIAAHRFILYCACPYFKALFDSPLQTQGQTVFEIPFGSGVALQQVVAFCYCDNIDINEDNVDDILQIASYLSLTELETKCGQFYRSVINAWNCVGIWQIADLHYLHDVSNLARKFTAHCFQDVVNGEEFINLTSRELSNVLTLDDLNVNGEEEIFTALVKWVRFDTVKRKGSFIDLIKHIRLNYNVMNSFFLEIVGPICRDLGLESVDHLLLPTQLPRRPPRFIHYFWDRYQFPGALRRQGWSIEVYDIWTDTWTTGATGMENVLSVIQPHILIGHQLIALDLPCPPQTPITMWNLLNGEIKELAPMPLCADKMTFARLNNDIYLTGGWGGTDNLTTLKSAVKYDLIFDKWTTLPPMCVARKRHASIAFGKKIFVMGGIGENTKPLKSVEYFDTDHHVWLPAPPMIRSRRRFQAGVAGDTIYVIGGDPTTGQYKEVVEMYSLEKNRWTVLALAPRITTVPDSTMKVIDEWIYLQLNRGEVSGFQKACNAFKRVNLKDKDADAECLKPFEKRGGADKFIVL